MDKVNISDKLDHIDTYWNPHLVGELNGQHVKLSKVKGDFVWHHHADADEMFLVIKGRLVLRMRDRDVILDPGEFYIMPRGVEHLPIAEEEVHLMLFEPEGTLNTGNVRNERTVDNPEWA
ncbi:MAG TPA: cupin domain-containing protein [Saprospiraceae bacterium]|nr:cupin domain-containing protein [Saprospiraceae bacterium]